MRRPIGRIANSVGMLLSIFPVAILLLLYVYVIRARLAVGRWPYRYHPHSYRFGADTHYFLLRPWFRELPFEWLPFAAFFYFIAAWIWFRSFPQRLFIVLAACTAVFYLCVFIDPFNFIDWYMD